MKKRLFLFTTLLLSAGLLSYFALSVWVTYTNNISLAKDTVTEMAQICAGLYTEEADLTALFQTGTDTRITVISPDGRVLADSRPLDLSTLGNHLDRPEIQAALQEAPAAQVRYSDTMGTDLIYYALKADRGDSFVLIRTALPAEKIDTYLWQSLPLLVLLLCLVALAGFLLARGMIGRITRPFDAIENKLRSLTGGRYQSGPIPGSFEEINKILRGIDEIADLLQGTFHDLRHEKAKLNYILNNIGDGLFVIDEEKNIVLINFAALAIFNAKPGVTDKNLNYLSYDQTIAAAVDGCIREGKNTLFELALYGRIYSAAVKRLPESRLTMVALADVTENRENAKRREEFFANASHELKTPLTAIKGFNELTAIHNKDENVCKYIDGITRETDRMLLLIGDMLKLSELESRQEGTVGAAEEGESFEEELSGDRISVSLGKIIEEIQEVLSTAIVEKEIRFAAVGDAEITAEPGHVYDLVKNLIENAVRYSHEGGSVSVRAEVLGAGYREAATNEDEQSYVRLSVSDDGIGIPPEEQTRIFERFYRVEKSRSQRNGGTGLGLSIVKHICVLYGWELALQSKPGVGTEVTVLFGRRSEG